MCICSFFHLFLVSQGLDVAGIEEGRIDLD